MVHGQSDTAVYKPAASKGGCRAPGRAGGHSAASAVAASVASAASAVAVRWGAPLWPAVGSSMFSALGMPSK